MWFACVVLAEVLCFRLKLSFQFKTDLVCSQSFYTMLLKEKLVQLKAFTKTALVIIANYISVFVVWSSESCITCPIKWYLRWNVFLQSTMGFIMRAAAIDMFTSHGVASVAICLTEVTQRGQKWTWDISLRAPVMFPFLVLVHGTFRTFWKMYCCDSDLCNRH